MESKKMIEHKLNARQVLVLEMLKDNPQPAIDLKCNELSAQSISSIIDKLEDQGLATRKRHNQDKRKVILGLTTKGKRLLA